MTLLQQYVLSDFSSRGPFFLCMFGGEDTKNVFIRVLEDVLGPDSCFSSPLSRRKRKRILPANKIVVVNGFDDENFWNNLDGSTLKKEIASSGAKLIVVEDKFPNVRQIKDNVIREMMVPIEVKAAVMEEGQSSTKKRRITTGGCSYYYYKTFVQGNKKSFLRFWVQGAADYFRRNRE